MKYLNIIKKIEIDSVRKKKKSKENFMSKKWIIRYWWLIFVVILYCSSLVFFIFSKNYIWAYILLISIYLLIGCSLSFTYKIIKREKRLFDLPFNRTINFNIKSTYCSDKKYLKQLISLDVSELKFGYLELNSEYEYFKKRINLFIGPVDKLGVLPGLIATIGVLPNTIDTFGINYWVSIFSYAYIGLIIFSLFFYDTVAKYERMLSLTKFVIESKLDK